MCSELAAPLQYVEAPVVIDQVVCAIDASYPVSLAVLGVDPVGARSGVQSVVAVVAFYYVVARTAVYGVVAIIAVEAIVTALAVQQVGTVAAEHFVAQAGL